MNLNKETLQARNLANLKSRLKRKQLRRARAKEEPALSKMRRVESLRLHVKTLERRLTANTTSKRGVTAEKRRKDEERLDILNRALNAEEASFDGYGNLNAFNESSNNCELVSDRTFVAGARFINVCCEYLDETILKDTFAANYYEQKFYVDGTVKELIFDINELCDIYSSSKLNSKNRLLTHTEFQRDSSSLRSALSTAIEIIDRRDVEHYEGFNALFGKIFDGFIGEVPNSLRAEPALVKIILKSLLEAELKLSNRIQKSDFHTIKRDFIYELLSLLSKYMYSLPSSKNSRTHDLVRIVAASVQFGKKVTHSEIEELPYVARDYEHGVRAVKGVKPQN